MSLYEPMDTDHRLYEPMDTDHRQKLLGLNQDNELERLISDVMNHKVSQKRPCRIAGTCETG